MKRVAMIGLLAVAGCAESLVKYEPLRDESRIQVRVRDEKGSGPAANRLGLSLMLTGKGKYPKDWQCTIFATAPRTKDEPDFWGDKATLDLNPDSKWGKKIEQPRYVDKAREPSYLDTLVMFDVEIDDAVNLAEGDGKIALNGKPFQLTPAERDKIRRAIVAAREATNAGK